MKRFYPARRDVIAVVVGILLVAWVIVEWVAWPIRPRLLYNWGFGPDWDCTYPGKGEPVCSKRTPGNPLSSY